MEKQTGSKLRKEYVKAVYCQPAYLTYMQSTSCKMPGQMKHKLKSRLAGEISIIRYADDTTLMAESETPGVSDGQGSLACCSPWGCKESDMTE